VVEK